MKMKLNVNVRTGSGQAFETAIREGSCGETVEIISSPQGNICPSRSGCNYRLYDIILRCKSPP